MGQKSTQKPILIAGPCSLEGKDMAKRISSEVAEMADKYGFDYVFKASFDKANRTSVNSNRGLGLRPAMDILKELGVKTTTDIHEPIQAKYVSEVVDYIQIPAFLCRQTDLLVAAGETGVPVNIKKGQMVSGKAMIHAVEKVRSTGNKNVMLMERGSMFGMNDLVVDFRQVVDMKEIAPVIMDCTHSIQKPNGGAVTGGQPKYIETLTRCAKAVNVDGYFFEVHPDPSNAWSDGANMIKLSEFENILKIIKSDTI